MKTTFIARLIRKSDGVSCSGTFEAHADLASAWIAAYEQFGLTHKIDTIYPANHAERVNWPAIQMTASAGPVELEEYDAPDPQFDPCLWDGDRIDATKSLLFYEHITGR